MVVRSNEDVADASLIYLRVDNIGDTEKHEIVKNIKFEEIINSTKNNFFYHHMVNFMNALEVSEQEIK